MRLLCILPGMSPPPEDPRTDQVYYYPPPLHGDVLLPVSVRPINWPKVLERFGTSPCPEYRVGSFTYHLFPGIGYTSGTLRFKLATAGFFLREGLRLSRKEKFDCILTYGWSLTGISALLLARLTGSKLIVTIPGIPEDAYRYNSYGNPWVAPKRDLRTRLAKRVSDCLLHFVLRRADCARLVYPGQLKAYPKLARVPTCVACDFVATADIPAAGVSDGSVLLVGAPWYIKGVDILIRAFRMIETEFPEAKLRLLGHYPGQDFKDLIGDSRQIEVLTARGHRETMECLAKCSVFALASRTDAQPRVLFEAMAAGKPLVASRVGGVPYYVQDGVNGLLFEPENVEDLARQLRTLLSSPELQARLGRNGMELARTKYTESRLGENILEMVERTVKGNLSPPVRNQASASPSTT